MAQAPGQRRCTPPQAHGSRSHWLSWTMFLQLLVGVYGGYFGAGIGILMLAALSLMGHTDIHQMNGVKNVLGASINALAALLFIYNGLVVWQDALIMMGGAILGGIGGAGGARGGRRPAGRGAGGRGGLREGLQTNWG